MRKERRKLSKKELVITISIIILGLIIAIFLWIFVIDKEPEGKTTKEESKPTIEEPEKKPPQKPRFSQKDWTLCFL